MIPKAGARLLLYFCAPKVSCYARLFTSLPNGPTLVYGYSSDQEKSDQVHAVSLKNWADTSWNLEYLSNENGQS